MKLVIAAGNRDRGDDGVGPAVAERLRAADVLLIAERMFEMVEFFRIGDDSERAVAPAPSRKEYSGPERRGSDRPWGQATTADSSSAAATGTDDEWEEF